MLLGHCTFILKQFGRLPVRTVFGRFSTNSGGTLQELESNWNLTGKKTDNQLISPDKHLIRCY